MRNIAGTEGINMGGTEKFYFVPQDDVTDVPLPLNAVITDNIILDANCNFFEIEAVIETIGASHSADQPAEGTLYDHQAVCLVKGDSPELLSVLEEMMGLDFLVLRKDTNGDYKLMGNEQQALRFSYELVTGDDWSTRKGYRLKFFGQLTIPEYFYTGSFDTSTETITPDTITLTEADGTTSTHPAGQDITAIQINALGSEALNNQLVTAQREDFCYIPLLKTGKTTSGATGDDGDLEKGRGTAWNTLEKPNVFGNLDRFTDTLGTQIYANNLVLDHQTGLMWYRSAIALNKNWGDSNTDAQSLSQGGYTDWRMPNRAEFFSILNHESLASAPINLSTTGLRYWTSTQLDGLYAYRSRSTSSSANTMDYELKSFNTDTRTIVCRNFDRADFD